MKRNIYSTEQTIAYHLFMWNLPASIVGLFGFVMFLLMGDLFLAALIVAGEVAQYGYWRCSRKYSKNTSFWWILSIVTNLGWIGYMIWFLTMEPINPDFSLVALCLYSPIVLFFSSIALYHSRKPKPEN